MQLEDGRIVTADENYIRESILDPGAKVVKGFKPIMPTFQGLVSEEQLNALVAYVKSQSQPGAAGTKAPPLRRKARKARRPKEVRCNEYGYCNCSTRRSNDRARKLSE